MQVIRVRTPQNVTIEYKIAGLGDRMLAYLFDVLVVISYFILLAGINYVLYQFLNEYVFENNWLFIAALLPWFFYDLLCEVFMEGQSFGKKVMKIGVVRLDGASVSLGNYLLRWLLGMVELRMFGGLPALFAIVIGGKGQRIGDMAAGTAVVHIKDTMSVNNSVLLFPDEETPTRYPQAAQLSDKDIGIIKEVLHTFNRTGNRAIVESAAVQVLSVFGLEQFGEKNAYEFLKQVIADHNRLVK